MNKVVNKINTIIRNTRELQIKKKAIKELFNNYKEENKESQKRILVWTAPGGMAPIIEIDSIIATALRLRSANIKFMVCDGGPVACIMRDVDIDKNPSTWQENCKYCYKSAQKKLKSFGLNYYRIGEFLNKQKRYALNDIVRKIHKNELDNFKFNDIDIGKLAVASTLRYSKGKDLENFEDILKRYILASLINMNAVKFAIDDFKPDLMLMSHGTYVDWGVAFKYGLTKRIPSVIWNSAFEKNHFFFRKEEKDFSKHRLERISENYWNQFINKPLTKLENKQLNKYLQNRYSSNKQNSKVNEIVDKQEYVTVANRLTKQYDTSILPPSGYSPKQLTANLDLDDKKPIWTLFTHVLWEGIYNYGPILFKDETNWLLKTIKTMIDIEDVNWLIRIHPGEMQYPGSKSALETIQKSYPRLPDQIKIIPPDQNINTLDILHLVSGGITIFGTVGLELAILGKPAILCGKGFYGNKGFTYDCNDENEFSNLLRKVKNLPSLSYEQVQLARKYAYVFFLKSQIPFPCLKSNSERFGWSLDVDKVDFLKPNGNHCIDLICRAILERNDFILHDASQCSL